MYLYTITCCTTDIDIHDDREATCPECGSVFIVTDAGKNPPMAHSADPCRICGKTASLPHTSITRAAHLAHYTRYGHSFMCPSPPAAE